ncbi:AAA family ATPase [Streptomyces sp. ISL-86]|uniref:AAA family ATPase n=1 Tax=Streptomyces sp. ISL-86 TaxID=2819187 RepID=UPI001BEB1855|nr:AAA family ATPase [Streptomyces sp. ISL-86]MBT2459515.1 AAA family ATPase [Streptomyces sp. ISL-86]
MPLVETEWGLVVTWVRDYLLDNVDPFGVLAQNGFPPEFVGGLPLTNKPGDNARVLVQATRQDIALQRHLLDVLVGLDELRSLPALVEAERFQARLHEDEDVHSTQDHFRANVLRNGTEVFIDRADLRKSLKEFLADSEKTVLVVDGAPDSGRSYSYNLIRHLGQHYGFRPVRVTLSRTATAAKVIRRLAEFVGDPGAATAPLNPTQLNDHLPSIDDAVHRVVSRATAADEQFWLVLDECDKLDANSDVWDCIGQLALAIYEHTPVREETAPRLVLLGYSPTMRQLPYDIRKNECRDTARVAGPDDLRSFFGQFFAESPSAPDQAEIAELVEVAVPAVLQAAQTPGDDSYMRKICTAAEGTVRAYRSLQPGEDFATRLRQDLLAAVDGQPEAIPDSRRAYREAACLLTGFDPTKLRLPGEDQPSGGAALELVHDCSTVSMRPSTTWVLKQEVRETALRGLAGPQAARLVLEANRSQFPEGCGPERIALSYLSGTPPALEQQDADQLADTLQAVLWLSQIPQITGIPDSEHVQRLMERARLLQPLCSLVEGTFCGRTKELAQLRAYVGLPADPAPVPLQQAKDGLLRTVTRTTEPPILVHGLGGMGKSTLLAKFLLDSLGDFTSGFPFAYVDFERPTLSIHEPITLIAEIARQLGIQYPGHRGAFDALADECEETARNQRDEQNSIDELYQLSTTRSGAGRSAAEAFNTAARGRETDLVGRVAGLLAQAVATPPGETGPPLVIVVDSFEEAQYRASPVVGRMWAIWASLQQVYPRLRFIVAGRATVNHPGRIGELLTIELGDLEPDAAVDLLMSCGVENARVARALADRVGGHPLSLKLAARAAVLAGGEADSLSDLVESLPTRRRHFYRTVDQMLVQGILYDRILKHIAQDEVRALAQAGLALRTVTPELIKDVLAEPCGLEVDSPEQARRLFGQLARLDLVVMAGPDSIRHRADLRAIMLRLSDKARTDLMRSVGQRAVEYYAAREGLEARAEEIYQRLRLNENPRAVEQRWEPGVERYLDNADQDMSPRSAAFLTGHLGGHTPDEVMLDADQEDWERIAAREVEDLLAQGFTDAAMARLSERRPWTPGSPLHSLFAETLSRTGRRKEAREAAEEAVNRAAEAGSADAQLDLLLLSARLAEEEGDLKEAELDLLEAEDLAAALGRDFDAMGAMLARARLTAAPDGDSEIDRRLARRLRQLPDDALAEQPALVRAVAAEVSRQDPAALDHTLEVVGLPTTDDSVLEALAEAISHVVAKQPHLRSAMKKILENAAAGPPQPPPPPGAVADDSPQDAKPTGAIHTSTSGILREARSRGTLDRLARRLLGLHDQSGELVSGVAAAMGSGNAAGQVPQPAQTPARTPAEGNGPKAA